MTRLNCALRDCNLGTSWDAIRIHVLALEAAGFDGIATIDHVIGAHPDRVAEETEGRFHTSAIPVHEPMIFLSFIAAVTRKVELSTSILLLPQRETVLVAKQCAELDRLSDGRLRVGVGVGRNFMEYEALHQDFRTRGRRMEEQVELLRKFWTEDHVTFDGEWHSIDRLGLNPMPVQQPIPIWMGSFKGAKNERVLERIGRMADGWMPQVGPEELIPMLERVRGYASDAGRDPASLQIECIMRAQSTDDPKRWLDVAEAFRDLGATHLKAFSPADTPEGVIRDLTAWIDVVGPQIG